MTSADFLYLHLKICIHIFASFISRAQISCFAIALFSAITQLLRFFGGFPWCCRWLQLSLSLYRHNIVSLKLSAQEVSHIHQVLVQLKTQVKVLFLQNRATDYRLPSISVLSVFAKWLNWKPNQLKQCVFVSSFWNLLHYK